MKPGIRVLGIDDAAFSFDDDRTFLTGVVYRGTEFIEDLKISSVDVDGENATEKVVELFQKCNNHRQIKAIILDGISFAGFNIVNLQEVAKETDKPVIAATSNRPDREKFRDTMDRTGNHDEVFEKMDEPKEIELEDGKVYIQFAGTDFSDAEEFVRKSIINGLNPEPVRVAHMIGQALKNQV